MCAEGWGRHVRVSLSAPRVTLSKGPPFSVTVQSGWLFYGGDYAHRGLVYVSHHLFVALHS